MGCLRTPNKKKKLFYKNEIIFINETIYETNWFVFFKLISYGYLLPVNLETHLKENKCTVFFFYFLILFYKFCKHFKDETVKEKKHGSEYTKKKHVLIVFSEVKNHWIL